MDLLDDLDPELWDAWDYFLLERREALRQAAEELAVPEVVREKTSSQGALRTEDHTVSELSEEVLESAIDSEESAIDTAVHQDQQMCDHYTPSEPVSVMQEAQSELSEEVLESAIDSEESAIDSEESAIDTAVHQDQQMCDHYTPSEPVSVMQEAQMRRMESEIETLTGTVARQQEELSRKLKEAASMELKVQRMQQDQNDAQARLKMAYRENEDKSAVIKDLQKKCELLEMEVDQMRELGLGSDGNLALINERTQMKDTILQENEELKKQIHSARIHYDALKQAYEACEHDLKQEIKARRRSRSLTWSPLARSSSPQRPYDYGGRRRGSRRRRSRSRSQDSKRRHHRDRSPRRHHR